VRRFLDLGDIVDPVVVYCSQWRPEPNLPVETPVLLPQICAVGLKRGA
jgi:hypothetical protein